MKVAVALDFTTSGAQPLKFERYYNSNTKYLRGAGFEHTRMGRGWRSNFDSKAQYNGTPTSSVSPSRAHFVLPQGHVFSFKKISGLYEQAYFDWSTESFVTGVENEHVTLVKNVTDARYELTTADDTVWSFDYDGLLQKITFRGGYEQELEYDTDNNNTAVEDSYGRRLEFTYSSTIDGLLESMDTPDGETYRFEHIERYDPDDRPNVTNEDDILVQDWVIEKVFFPDSTPADPNDNPKLTYHYENNSFPFALTGITDQEDIRYATWVYGTDGRVTASKHAGDIDEFSFSYDDVANKVTVTNPLSKQAIYEFETDDRSLNRLKKIDGQASTNCPASFSEIAYDTNDFIDETTDEEGNVTKFVRNTKGQATSITEGFGTSEVRTITKSWHADFNVETQVVEPGLTTDYTYNTSGQLTELEQTDTTSHTVPYSTDGETRTWTYTYTTEGLLDTVDGPLSGTGDTVDYDYDADGFVTKITNELGHITDVTAVNGRGQPTSIVDPNSVQTDMTYDLHGRLKTVTVDPGVSETVTTISYDDIGQITEIERPDGATLTYAYDDARRLTSITNGDSEKIEYTRNDMGEVTARKIKNSGSTIVFSQTQTFDELNRLLKHIGASTQTTEFAYDKVSNLTSVEDPRSNVYAFAYDALNRLIKETDEDSDEIDYTLDGRDNITTYEDPRNLDTVYVRNGFGDIIRRTSPDSGITDYEVNELALVTKITDARSIVTNLTYDDAGRVLTKTFPAATGENVTYTYDSVASGNKGKGRLTQISDESGSTTFFYDVRGNVTSETRTIQSQAHTVDYTYDDADRITQVVYPSGRIVTYNRDSEGRVSSVTSKKDSGSASVDIATNIGWQPMSGVLQALTHGNGLSLWKTFTDDYQLDVHLVEDTSTSTDIIKRSHTRTDDLNLTNIWDDVTPANNQAFWYSATRRLQNADGPWGDFTFYHDGIGNRTSKIMDTGSTVTHTYGYGGSDNRLAGVDEGLTTIRDFDYLANGNIESDDRNGTLHEYTWNHANRLKTVTVASSLKGTYIYNALEQQVARTLTNMTPSGTIHSIHDRAGNLIAETDGFGNTVREYIWLEEDLRADDQAKGRKTYVPLAVVDDVDTVSPKLYFVHGDHLNRPIKMTDGTKATVWDAVWLPFGGTHSISGSASNNARLPGQWFQLESDLHYNWHRSYDPTTGRYTKPDPLGLVDGPSVYSYAANSPQMLVDRDGRLLIPVAVAGGIAGAASNAVIQYLNNGGDIRCIDLSQVAIAGAAGALTGAFGGLVGHLGLLQQIGLNAGFGAGVGAVAAHSTGGNVLGGVLSGAAGGITGGALTSAGRGGGAAIKGISQGASTGLSNAIGNLGGSIGQ